MNMSKEKVLLGMSGGVDSTAACRMLLSAGYDVVGLTLLTCDASVAASDEAALLAERFGIEHHVADVREQFNKAVVEPFVQAYLSGRTPNPCVDCNPAIKFAVLEEWADRLGCRYIATGHYVRKVCSDGRYYVRAGADAKKDQSYFLWRLSQKQLERVLFPLGEWTKEDVRRHLHEFGLEEKATDGESMEICFMPGDYRDFLRSTVANVDDVIKPGAFVDSEGRRLGEHKGFPYYTIGQRKGLNIALGYPAYVLKINPQKNTVMLGEASQLLTRYMMVETPCWVDAVLDEGLTVRIRYRSRPVPCKVVRELPDGHWLVRFDEPVSAVTPGQSAVFYKDDVVAGGAYIASQRGINQWITDDDNR
ncbi:MAG: tRNA 2-thiouridine(34) synthase MnmA [Bacteroidaceae bacterium]|nr:tRNA 2-thiouridine(34) synthase MnmA [Bacteroidaceae bacterium]MBR5277225.1 tRNA 2-thiouridine(34) synthase MnmA [Bacteroidaceae bacterium]